MSLEAPLHLFEGIGIELEYMLVDQQSLNVLPKCDEILAEAAGTEAPPQGGEVEMGEISWSNELVLHVLEFKTTDPPPDLVSLPELFQDNVRTATEILARKGGRLMPGAMHPLMDPQRETRLWPHGNGEVYAAYDRIFGCNGHSWSNLQSTHINLPFGDDEEFGRLHAAIRLVLPLIPGLAASSPVVDGRINGTLDNRLEVYRKKHQRLPVVSGLIIPEPCFSRQAYERLILDPMYTAVAGHDPAGILRHPWLNARGAIARFDRSSIEIRLIDAQECPKADLAVAAAVVAVVRMLVLERYSSYEDQKDADTETLADLLHRASVRGEKTVVNDVEYLDLLGCNTGHATLGQLWQSLLDDAYYSGDLAEDWQDSLDLILTKGPLARRLGEALHDAPGEASLFHLYRRLCDCLDAGELFGADT